MLRSIFLGAAIQGHLGCRHPRANMLEVQKPTNSLLHKYASCWPYTSGTIPAETVGGEDISPKRVDDRGIHE